MLLQIGPLLRLGPHDITDGTFITLGSSYHTCAFYRPLIQTTAEETLVSSMKWPALPQPN